MYLLFDIGGTHMRFATSNGKSLEHIRILDTPENFASAIALFRKATDGLPPGKIKKVIGGIPRFNKGKINFWHTHPTQKTIEAVTKSKVILINDAELSGLGEAVYGAGKQDKIIAYLTFSTGFGGARIIDKKIDANNYGFEPDLQISNYNPAKKTSTRIGIYTSGRGIFERYGKNPERIKNKKIWSEIENWIGVAVNNSAAYWSPDSIILGGAIASNKNISTARIEKMLSKRFAQMPKVPKIKKASLGQLSGLYGALALTK